MFSSLVSRASAALLAALGLALLFAPDALLPRLVPRFPPAALWLGQLLGAAAIALAALDWLSRSLLLGGIYGRSVVMPNAAFFFIAALVLLRAASRAASDDAATLWVAGAVLAVPALVYGWLLLRGPLERDLQARRANPSIPA